MKKEKKTNQIVKKLNFVRKILFEKKKKFLPIFSVTCEIKILVLQIVDEKKRTGKSIHRTKKVI